MVKRTTRWSRPPARAAWKERVGRMPLRLWPSSARHGSRGYLRRSQPGPRRPDRALRAVPRDRLSASGQKRVDYFPLPGEIGIGNRCRPVYAAARAARELSRGHFGPPHDGSNLVERHGEHVVQHEGEPLGGLQLFEYDEQRETYRFGQQHLALRIASLALRGRLRRSLVLGLLAARITRAQDI